MSTNVNTDLQKVRVPAGDSGVPVVEAADAGRAGPRVEVPRVPVFAAQGVAQVPAQCARLARRAVLRRAQGGARAARQLGAHRLVRCARAPLARLPAPGRPPLRRRRARHCAGPRSLYALVSPSSSPLQTARMSGAMPYSYIMYMYECPYVRVYNVDVQYIISSARTENSLQRTLRSVQIY